jgi:hypothetical protein
MPALRAVIKHRVMTLKAELRVIGVVMAAFRAVRHRLGFPVAAYKEITNQVHAACKWSEDKVLHQRGTPL